MYTPRQSKCLSFKESMLSVKYLNAEPRREWFAVYTLPKNEHSVLRQLEIRDVDAFLPTYEVTRVWRNRQRVKIAQPLFPTYLFVQISCSERVRVLQSPGVLGIVGNSRGPLPIQGSEIEYLRSPLCKSRLEPFADVPLGTRVRIKNGPFAGVAGTLVHRKNSLRFVLTIELINQNAALEASPEDLEPIPEATGDRSSLFGAPRKGPLCDYSPSREAAAYTGSVLCP